MSDVNSAKNKISSCLEQFNALYRGLLYSEARASMSNTHVVFADLSTGSADVSHLVDTLGDEQLLLA